MIYPYSGSCCFVFDARVAFALFLAGLGIVQNERAYSVESSLQGISSSSLLWKRNK